MVVELVDVEVLAEPLQQPDVIAVGKRVAEGKVHHISLALEEILKA